MVELKKSGTEVIAICKPSSRIEQYLKTKGIDCQRLPSYSKFSLPSYRIIKKTMDLLGVNVVHVHFHKDIWLASLALKNDSQRKLFLSVYMGVDSKNDIFHRWIYNRVNGIFTSSDELNSRLHLLYPVEKERIHFLPYGRRVEDYVVDQVRRKAVRSQWKVHRNELLVGTMVRIDPGKGVMDFARSFLYLEKDSQAKVRYIIVGEPTRRGRARPDESPYEPHCEAYLRQLEAFIATEHLEDKILLAGFQEDLVGYLSAMDVFVFPSRDELYSLVVLDAMCMGLPVVAARAGGNVAQIKDGVSGSLYDVADSQDLCTKLALYLKQPPLRKQHGEAARKFVAERHDMRNTIAQLLEFYRRS